LSLEDARSRPRYASYTSGNRTSTRVVVTIIAIFIIIIIIIIIIAIIIIIIIIVIIADARKEWLRGGGAGE
jgi:hypothetical protein